jgi:hypothetical protein
MIAKKTVLPLARKPLATHPAPRIMTTNLQIAAVSVRPLLLHCRSSRLQPRMLPFYPCPQAVATAQSRSTPLSSEREDGCNTEWGAKQANRALAPSATKNRRAQRQSIAVRRANGLTSSFASSSAVATDQGRELVLRYAPNLALAPRCSSMCSSKNGSSAMERNGTVWDTMGLSAATS